MSVPCGNQLTLWKLFFGLDDKELVGILWYTVVRNKSDAKSDPCEIDQKIVMAILQGKSYEQMEEMLFMSGSAIRYRRSRIFRDAGVSNRAEFEQLLTSLYSI